MVKKIKDIIREKGLVLAEPVALLTVHSDTGDIITKDDRGNVIKHTCGDYEITIDYDDKDNVIHWKNNEGSEEWAEYDKEDNLTDLLTLEDGSYTHNDARMKVKEDKE